MKDPMMVITTVVNFSKMKQIFDLLPFAVLFAMLWTASSCAQKKLDKMPMTHTEVPEGMEVAFFADACYWCTEGIWEALDVVYSVES